MLNGATVAGDFSGWDFSGAQLPGATLNGTDVSGADLSGADLRGAQMTSLVTSSPPELKNVRIGARDGVCTLFKNSDLVGSGIAPVQADAVVTGCASTAMFPGSEIPISVVALLSRTYKASVDYSDAIIVVTAGNTGALAGADLSGIHLAGASFIGFPADLRATSFDGASLIGTSMELANLSKATFLGAAATSASFEDAVLDGAQFTGSATDLANADFAGADVSNASFQNATLTGAVFDDALADSTSFESVVATNTRFVGAHVYDAGDAFEGARQLTGADFTDAVLAGSADGSAGLDFTNADLTDAKFDGAQCVACNFSGATMTGVTVTDAYLPGAQLSTATLQNASFDGTWLYCGNLQDTACKTGSGALQWPLSLGSREDYGPVSFATTTLTQGAWADVTLCPDATPPEPGGLEPDCGGGHMLANRQFSVPLACSAVALDACPTLTSTLDQTSPPQAVVPATPPTWPSGVTGAGYYVAGADSAVRLVDPTSGGPPSLVAGTPNSKCTPSTAACGDGGAASGALLSTPTALALGLDGSLYIADPGLDRVRRIAPGGTITTVAGTGQACAAPADACGDGGPATAAALADPQGVWVSPSGQIFIADGKRGLRRIGLDGTISTVPTGTPGTYDIVSVAGDADGIIWAAANDPDYILKVDVAAGTATQAVGTGTSGYNGVIDPNSQTPLAGNQVQINAPHSLSVALNGFVVFADTANHMIRAYNAGQDTVADDLAGLLDADGNPEGGFNGDGQYADATKLDSPLGVTVTRGALYVVADTGNGRLRQVGPPPPSPDLEPKPPVVKPPVVKPPVVVPPVAEPPDNRFSIRRVKVKRDGSVKLRVRVRAAGRLRALVTTKRNGRQRPFAKGERQVRRAGTVTLRARPTARGKRILRRDHGRLALRLAVTFRPTGGDPRTDRMRGLRLPAS